MSQAPLSIAQRSFHNTAAAVLFDLLLRPFEWHQPTSGELLRMDAASRKEFLGGHEQQGALPRRACASSDVQDIHFGQMIRLFCVVALLCAFALTRQCPQVNTLFDNGQAAAMKRCRALVADASCVYFQVGGVFVVTLRVVSAVVAAVITLSTWLNW
jgi:hypothetical protein